MVEQGVDAQARCVAGRADRHGLPGGELGRQWNEPVAVEPGALSESAPVSFADTPAVEHDAVTCLPVRVAAVGDDAGEVDAWDHRKLAHHRRLAGDGETILEVQRRVIHVDGHVPVGELRLIEVRAGNGLPGLTLIDQNCRKHR